MTDAERLELAPEAAAERKRRAFRRLHSVQFPVFRLIGMTLMVLVVLLSRSSSLDPFWTAAVPLGYALLSWALLIRWERLGPLFLFLDVLIYCFIIYVTGIEQSWFIFLLMIRVADQIPAGLRRTLAFAHFNVLCYVAMLAYAAWQGHRVDLPVAAHKTLIVYLTGIYLCLGALSAGHLHRRASAALRMSRELIARLEERTKELEIANQTRARFLANISHELRTPMNGVLGMLDLTLETELSESQRANLHDSRDSALALLEVLNDILDLGKLESGRFLLNVEPFELDGLLAEVQGRFPELSTVSGDLAVRVRGDRERLRKVLVSLLDNAFKYARDVSLQIELADGRLRARVVDRGAGIEPERLERMFRPFERGDDSLRRAQGGTGLGLPICRDLARLMGGELRAESKVGEGSTFTLEVPLERLADAPSTRSLRVLVAEDNPVNQRLCLSVLERLGHRSVLAPDGLIALALIGNEEFDLVLLDVQMPGMDGLEVARRAREAGHRLPIIVLTASTEVDSDPNVDAFLPKPLRLQQLRLLLERYASSAGGPTSSP